MSKPLKDKNISIPEHILEKLLTPSEKRMLKNRWEIIRLLEKDLSIREIAAQVKVGTDTVVRVIRMVEKKNLLNKKVVKNEIQSSTPWIFGKNR